jgi:hypothetical protein
MTMRRFSTLRAIASVVAAQIVILLCTSPGHACECVLDPHRRDFRRMAAVFVGRVVRITDAPGGRLEGARTPVGKDSACGPEITFEVVRWFKGTRRPTIRIRECIFPCPSREPFKVGVQYLVYAEGAPLGAVMGCARTRHFADADYRHDREVRQLGSPWFRVLARIWP